MSTELSAAAKQASEKAVLQAISESKPNGTTPDDAEGAASTSLDLDQASGTTATGKQAEEPEKSVKTVFDDKEHFNAVHGLAHRWTLWFDNASKADKAKSWEEQLTKVMTFSSVEEFWGLYNHVVPPSFISANSNFYLFKEGIRPAWEDVANAQGGKWSVQLPKEKSRDVIDRWWLYTLLAAIGEMFETPFGVPQDPQTAAQTKGDQVTGIIMSSRKAFYRINIWTRDSDEKSKVEHIGQHLKYDVLQFAEGSGSRKPAGEGKGLQSDVEFVSHKASQQTKNPKGWTV